MPPFLAAAVLLGASCTGGQASAPSSNSMQKHTAFELTALQAALPKSASVSRVPDQTFWGNVIVVDDSRDRMSLGPPPGSTYVALKDWLSLPSNKKVLRDPGWDYVLACHTGAGNDVGMAGSITGLSEMIPLVGVMPQLVRTGQPGSTDLTTTIDCN